MGDAVNNQNEDRIKEMERKIQKLEEEKKRMDDEFNAQRAKMKDLFLKREKENAELKSKVGVLTNELDEAKSQLLVAGLTLETNMEEEKRKADEEIASLQKCLNETIEESSSTKDQYCTELSQLQTYNHQLLSEIDDLKRQQQQSPHHAPTEHSLAPSVVLNALTKGIAKKLGADSFSSQESSEEKTNDGPELLKSLVESLEDQIKALKEKLRATDEQLQKCKECRHSTESEASQQPMDLTILAANPAKKADGIACDMCTNYEEQLVIEQKKTSALETKVSAAEKAVDRHKEDLIKEIGFRKEMEEKWNEKKEELKQQVLELTKNTECLEQDLKDLRGEFLQTGSILRDSLAKLTKDREAVQLELNKLQRENDNLIGKYSIHSQELQSEVINLPDTVEELQESILKNHEELIRAKIGKEAAEEKVNDLHSEILLLKDQTIKDQTELKSLESSLAQEIDVLKKEKFDLEKERRALKIKFEESEIRYHKSQRQFDDYQREILELKDSCRHLMDLNSELKNRASSLQQDLDNSEAVQKDFVRLSQSLQVQLEKIRCSDSQVRWQHEDDINECPSCHSNFSNVRRKQHCLHCGQIFCNLCLTKSVNSGPNSRPARVCDVCHTLLVQSSAPYFSETAPTP